MAYQAPRGRRRQGDAAARELESYPDPAQGARAADAPAAVQHRHRLQGARDGQHRRADDAERGRRRAGAHPLRAERRHQGPGRAAGGPLRQGGPADGRRPAHRPRAQAPAKSDAGRPHLGRRDGGDWRARPSHAVEGWPPVRLLRLQGPRVHRQPRRRERAHHGGDRSRKLPPDHAPDPAQRNTSVAPPARPRRCHPRSPSPRWRPSPTRSARRWRPRASSST